MRPGNSFLNLIIILLFIISKQLNAEEKITTSPLINLNQIKPSFEEQDTKNENISVNFFHFIIHIASMHN